MSDAVASKPRFVRAVRRGLRRANWKLLTNSLPAADIFVRSQQLGYRLIVCVRDWREVTPTRLSDLRDMQRRVDAPIVCVFPQAPPQEIEQLLREHRFRVTTIDALETLAMPT